MFMVAPNQPIFGGSGAVRCGYGISDNDRKYYSLERAKDVLGYDPQDNSAEWDGDERIA